MARRAGVRSRLVGTIKANEHGSKVGATPPVVLFTSDVAASLAELDTEFAAFRDMLANLVVGGSLAGCSASPGTGMILPHAGDAQYLAGYQVAAKMDDWPEANANRTARVILSDASREHTYRLRIPYLADLTSEDDVRSALLAFMTAYPVYSSDTAAGVRLTEILSVNITSR